MLSLLPVAGIVYARNVHTSTSTGRARSLASFLKGRVIMYGILASGSCALHVRAVGPAAADSAPLGMSRTTVAHAPGCSP